MISYENKITETLVNMRRKITAVYKTRSCDQFEKRIYSTHTIDIFVQVFSFWKTKKPHRGHWSTLEWEGNDAKDEKTTIWFYTTVNRNI